MFVYFLENHEFKGVVTAKRMTPTKKPVQPISLAMNIEVKASFKRAFGM